jgi:hypothetical protein
MMFNIYVEDNHFLDHADFSGKWEFSDIKEL